uniref:Uncharacterized protein n=1 Tax=Anguilla anguilla TaxID=7936 RepID=A0A0E9S3L6_ANGAN
MDILGRYQLPIFNGPYWLISMQSPLQKAKLEPSFHINR